MLVWDGTFLRSRSAAAIALAEALPGIWSLGRHIDLFPLRFRDQAYNWVAQNRYKWFGKYEACWIPKPPDRRKFLDLQETGLQHAGDGDQAGKHSDPDKWARHL